MQVNIWVPVLSFVTGVLIPFLYGRFSYNGISIRLHVYALGVVTWCGESYAIHSVITKIVNISSKPIALEGIDIRDFRPTRGSRFRLSTIDLGKLTDHLEAYLPNNEAPLENQLAFPIVVSPNAELHLTFESKWRYSVRQPDGKWKDRPADEGISDFAHRITTKGIDYRIKVNGKYRGYNYTLGRGNTISGYRFVGRLVPSDRSLDAEVTSDPSLAEARNGSAEAVPGVGSGGDPPGP